MEASPFPYQGPLEPGTLHANAGLIDDLVERVSERRVTALLGPRRFGKTTALRSVIDRLTDTATPIWLDLYALSSWGDLADRLDRALAAVAGVGSPSVSQLAARIDLPLGVMSVELRKPPQQRPDPLLIVRSQLDLIISASSTQSLVLVIDEFSGITGVEGAAATLRTALQHHYRDIGLLFAGSEPSTMQMLFTDRAEPFYGQADLVEMPSLDLAAVESVIRRGFEATNRHVGPTAPMVHAFTKGHPQRTMELADAVWRQVQPDATAGADDVALAIADMLAAASAGLERMFVSLALGEQLVLRVIAKGEPLFGSYAGALGLSGGGAQHAREKLVDRGHIRRTESGLTIVDPVMAEWLRHRFG